MRFRYFGRQFTPFQQILVLILAILAAAIVLGTVVSFVVKKAVPASGLRKADPAPEQILQNSRGQSAVYMGIGQLRAVTADNPPEPLVITPYFPYPEHDSAFYEEIVQKNRKMRSVILDYFARRTKRELLSHGELAVKADLLQLINAELIMGSIAQMYFTEYIFL